MLRSITERHTSRAPVRAAQSIHTVGRGGTTRFVTIRRHWNHSLWISVYSCDHPWNLIARLRRPCQSDDVLTVACLCVCSSTDHWAPSSTVPSVTTS